MNKWNRLLKALDQVFGFEYQLKSSFKKIRQGFDEKSNEHVVIIEYRVMKDESPAVSKKRQEEARQAMRFKAGELLKDIHARVMARDGDPGVDSPGMEPSRPDHPA